MEIYGNPVFIRHSDIRANGETHLKLRLCKALHHHVPNCIVAAQQKDGVWKIWVKTTMQENIY